MHWPAKLTPYLNERQFGINPETDYDAKILGPVDRAIALAPDALWAYYVKSVYLYYSSIAAIRKTPRLFCRQHSRTRA